MKIVLLGYGKTGSTCETVAIERGHTIADRFDIDRPFTEKHLSLLSSQTIDCCIDFSAAEAVPHNIRLCVEHGIPIVVGTTGWQSQLAEISTLIQSSQGSLVHASNFSIGAHVFMKIVTAAAALLNSFPEYDVAVHETHHRLKKDAPSGTALTIAGVLLEQLQRKQHLQTNPDASGIAPEDIHISSTRLGSVFGTHTVAFSSTADEIELTHRANNRRGFAIGAVMAAEWVQGRRGVFTAAEVFG